MSEINRTAERTVTRRRNRRGRVLVPAAAVLALASACTGNETPSDSTTSVAASAAPTPGSPVTAGSPATSASPERTTPGRPSGQPTMTPSIGRVTLTPNNFCKWTPAEPQPPVALEPEIEMQMDGRCGAPLPKNGELQTNSIGVYRVPFQNPDEIRYRLSDGDIVSGICKKTDGQEIIDARNVIIVGAQAESTKVWAMVNAPGKGLGIFPDNWAGYIGDVVLPNCTPDQLEELSRQPTTR